MSARPPQLPVRYVLRPASRLRPLGWLLVWVLTALPALVWLYMAFGFAGDDALRSAYDRIDVFACVVVFSALLGLFVYLQRHRGPAFVLLLYASLGGIVLFFAIFGPPGFVACLLLAVCGSLIVRTIRRRRAMTVLGYIEQAVRLNLPMNHTLAAAAASETGMTWLRLTMIADAVAGGSPLELALAEHLPELPQRMLQLIAAGARLGSLPQVLHLLTHRERQARASRNNPARYAMVYATVLLLTMASLVSVYCILILPKLRQIFKDFGISMPSIAVWVSGFGQVGGYVLLGVAGMVVLVYLGVLVWEMFRPGDPSRHRPRWAAWLVWITPVARGVARDQGLADVCRVAGEALRAGFPLYRALGEATTLALNPGLQAQICRWSQNIEGGASVSDAARTAGLPSLLAGMLGSAQISGTMADVFDFLARYYETRFSRAVLLLQGAVAPIISLVFGAMACVMALSLFLPMIRLLERAGTTWHRIRY